MSILNYNGGAVVAMKGKDCVAIATDKRFGIQMQTVDVDFQRVFELGPSLYVGLPGLATDTQTVFEKLRFRKNLYELREGRKITPKVLSNMLSSMLYSRRFGPWFVEPVVAGYDDEADEPFICNMDLIGCINKPEDFVVSGSCSHQLLGMCETLWRPDLNRDELLEIISQAFLSAMDRDASSGWGARVVIVNLDGVEDVHLKTRMD